MPLVKKILFNKYLLVAFFVIAYFGVRLSFFNSGWDGTDANGIDTDIFLNHPQKPNYLLISSIGGRVTYAPAYGHPAPMYEAFGYMGDVFQIFYDFKNLDGSTLIFCLKTIVASAQLLVFLLLIFSIFSGKRILSSKNDLVLLGLIFLFSVTPIAINNSNEFQLDSLFGVLAFGLLGLSIGLGVFRVTTYKLFLFFVFIACFFVGIGKNEWTLAMGLALGAGLLWVIVRKRLFGVVGNSRDDYWLLVSIFVGLAFGNLASYVFEPSLYLSGWKLLSSMAQKQTLFGSAGLMQLKTVTRERFVYIFPLLVTILFIGIHFLKRPRSFAFPLLFGYLVSLALFFSFFFSTWGSYPRYFAPSFIVLLTVGAIVFRKYQGDITIHFWPILLIVLFFWSCYFMNRHNLRLGLPMVLLLILATMFYLKYRGSIVIDASTIQAIVVLFLVYQAGRYILSDQIASQHVYGTRNTSIQFMDKDCVHVIPLEDAYQKTIDFVHAGMGYDSAEKIAAEHGMKLCPKTE
ncbi:hypothetical protein JW899_01975 [Candidatus Uhrbacteria bacterium]|nr:hypothetical protein [Candidatus Uhrbacteria bacterium]